MEARDRSCRWQQQEQDCSRWMAATARLFFSMDGSSSGRILLDGNSSSRILLEGIFILQGRSA
eukprot:scaffold246_cov364-Pavlova_lutheri.AAC.5